MLKQQSGAALITALSMLLVMTLLALSSLKGTGMNNQQIRNIQTMSAINKIVEGEIFAQAARFSVRNAFVDQFVIDASVPGIEGLPIVVNRISDVGVATLQPVTELRNLSTEGNADPLGRQLFGDNNLCPGLGAGYGCEKMLLTVQANHPQLGRVAQHIGFGVVTPPGSTTIRPGAAAPAP